MKNSRWVFFLAKMCVLLLFIAVFGLIAEEEWLTHEVFETTTEEIAYLADTTTLELYSHFLAGSSGKESLIVRYGIEWGDELRICSDICENTNVCFVEKDGVTPQKITVHKWEQGNITDRRYDYTHSEKITFVVPEGTIKRSFEMDGE